ncbi:hypothetical protein E0H59_13665 [Rhizobium leguminosarum bv. viciae]|nr:hypothetical protein E0H59_13665 [Rhizobium leguminosarum bv. viciae]
MSNNSPGIFAQFSLEPVEQTFLSEKEGRPIFADKEFIRIMIAGDKHSEVYREATENDKTRFHEIYSRFKDGMKDRDQIVGTPLAQWPFLKPSQIREFEAINIFTVEQLASLSDTMKQRVGMGANEIVAAAAAYLASAKDSSVAGALAAENERLKADMERLTLQVQELASRLENEDKARAGRGRAAA